MLTAMYLELKSASSVLAASLYFPPIPLAPLTLLTLRAVLAELGRVSVAMFCPHLKLSCPTTRFCKGYRGYKGYRGCSD